MQPTPPCQFLVRTVFAWLWLVSCLTSTGQNLSQTITWQTPQSRLAKLDVATPLKAFTSSGLPVQYALLSGPAVLEGSELKATNVGTLVVEIRAPGSNLYRPVTNRFILNPDAVQLTHLATLSVGEADSLRDVRLRGHFAYVAADKAGLKIIDIQDPAAPKLVGELDTAGFAYGLDIVGDLVYVADYGGLAVVDVADPSHPVQLSYTRLQAAAVFGVQTQGNRAYVAGQTGGLFILDITDPARPLPLGRWDSPGRALDLDVQDGLVFLADNTSGLQIVDVSNPANPIRLAWFDTPGIAFDVQVATGIAYVADGTSGLVSIDVRDPFRPQRLDSFSQVSAGKVRGVGTLIFASSGSGGPSVFDVIQPDDIRLMQKVGDTSGSTSLDLAGDLLALVTSSGELRLYRWRRGVAQSISASFPPLLEFTNAPLPLSATVSSGLPVRYSVVSGPARVVNDQLILTGEGTVELKLEQPGNSQLFPTSITRSFRVMPNQTITWGSPADPLVKLGVPHRLRAEASSGLPVTYRVLTGPAKIVGDELTVTNLSLTGSIIVVAEQAGSDVFVPASLHHAFNRPAFADLPIADNPDYTPEAVQVVGSRVYLVDDEHLRVVDITNPQRMVELGSSPLPPSPSSTWTGNISLSVAAGHAYVCAGDRGMFIYDLVDPSHPVLVGQFSEGIFPGGARAVRVVVRDQTAYLAAGSGGLIILDLKDPAHPLQLSSLLAGSFALSLRVRGDVAYLLDYYSGLHLLDVSHPDQPRLLSTTGLSHADDIDVRDDLIAVMVGNSDLAVLDVRDPARPVWVGGMSEFSSEYRGARAVQVEGNFAFIAGYFSGVGVVDLSDLAHPAMARSVTFNPNPAAGLQVTENVAYWSDSEGLHSEDVRPRHPQKVTLQEFSAALPLNRPQLLHAESSSGRPVNFRVISGPAYVDNGSLVITNLATVILEAEPQEHPDLEPSKLRRVLNKRNVKFDRLGEPILQGRRLTSVRLVGDIAYVASQTEGLHLVNVSDPANLAPLSLYPISMPGEVQVVGNLAFVVDQPNPPTDISAGLTILDVSQPAGPYRIGQYTTETSPSDLFVDGDRVYLTFGTKQLLVVDVSTPSKPVKTVEYTAPDWTSGITVRHPYAYLTAPSGGLQLVELGLPNQLRPVKFVPGRYLGMQHFRGNTAFFSTETQLQTWDVSVPGELHPLSRLDAFFSIHSVTLGGDSAYVLQSSSVTLVEARDPRHLIRLGTLFSPDSLTDVAASNDLLFVTHYFEGLSVYRTRFTLQPTLSSVSFPTRLETNEVLTLPAVSPEGFALRYSVVSGPGQIEGGKLRFTEPGSLVLRWESDGTDLFEPAVAEQTLTVEPPVVPPPLLTLTREGQTVHLTWTQPTAILESAATPAGEWIQVSASSPHDVVLGEEQRFFRVRSTE